MSKLGFPSEDALAYNDGCCCNNSFIARSLEQVEKSRLDG